MNIGVGEAVTWAPTGVCVLGALLFIHWMEKIPSQFLRPAIEKVLKQISSPFHKKETITTSGREDRGAKSNGQAMKLGDSNASAATPTLPSPEASTHRGRWFSRKQKDDSTGV